MYISINLMLHVEIRKNSQMKKKGPSKNNKTILDDFSSKVKKVYIELHNYSFFHGPSEADNIDNRFIGRERIIDRLKVILSQSKTKTGAYLVTGYRGAGKSSFVNKVISSITTPDRIHYITHYYILLLFAVIFIQYIGEKLDITSVFSTTFLAINILAGYGILLYYLYDQSSLRSEARFIDIFKSWRTFRLFLGLFFYNSLIVRRDYVINTRFIRFTQFIYLIIICFIIDFFVFDIFNLLNGKYQSIFISYLIAITPTIIDVIQQRFANYRSLQKKYVSKNDFVKWLRSVVEVIYSPIKQHFNFSHRFFIKINLGNDDLNVEDIFKLIARNLETQFKTKVFSSKKLYLLKLMILFIIYSLSYKLYYDGPGKVFFTSVKKNTNITLLFPSQDNVLLSSDKMDVAAFSDFVTRNKTIIEKSNKYSVFADYLFQPVVYSINYIDLFIYKFYYEIYRIIVIDISPFKISTHKSPTSSYSGYDASFIPPHLDYLFIIYYFSIIFLIFILNRIFKIKTSKRIYNKIRFLNELIDAEISINTSSNISVNQTPFSLSRLYRKEKKYKLAGVKEIEKMLISIFDDIDSIPPFHYKPEFIFVFDELDKIEPQNGNAKEAQEDKTNNNYLATESSRNRQQTIFRFLSNMKFFLSTAKAKFIFIAGREMYDASLADASDRSFYIKSIFHDIIYVDSFLSDSSSGNLSDITCSIEEFVCQFLIPKKYIIKNKIAYPGLKEYNAYLLDQFDELKVKETNKNNDNSEIEIQNVIAKQKREKIIFLLHQFIIFLTHMSNGSPKKVTSIFESFIKTMMRNKADFENKLIVRKYRKSNLFLVFDFYEQYRIGMTCYLANPIILSIANVSKGYSDKLLVSAGFLIDHLFKFHKNSFSGRTLEIAPEIIDIHRTSELRNFINEIIGYLSQTHLQEIDTGIYQYKFNKRISNETSFLSKISEEASASFNFTLDESLAIIEHYKDILAKTIGNYEKAGVSNDNVHIHSISHIHMIIGDLHFYDEDFNQSINEYLDAIEFLRRIKPKKYTIELMVLLIRNMLKLGFAFEKRKSYSSAMLTYGQLAKLLIDYRSVDLAPIGLKEEKAKDWNSTLKVENRAKTSLWLSDEDHDKYSSSNINNDEFIDLLSKNIIPETEEILLKLAAFEGIRLIFQPLLAKLFLIEKNQLGGITMIDLIRVDSEFHFLTKALKKNEKYILISDFYCNVGDILYYKNGNLIKNVNCNKSDDSLFKSVSNCCSCFKPHIENTILNDYSTFCETRRTVLQKKQYKTPCISCYYFKLSLLSVLDTLLPEFRDQAKKIKQLVKEGDTIENDDEVIDLNILEYIIKEILQEDSKIISHRSNAYKLLAKVLSNIGDTYLSCSLITKDNTGGNEKDAVADKPPRLNRMNFKNVMEIFKYIKNRGEMKIGTEEHSHSELILLYYCTSHLAYKKAHEHKRASFQYVKILYYINEYISTKISDEENNYIGNIQGLVSKEDIDKLLIIIKDEIVYRAINSLYLSYNNIHITEINKFKQIFTEDKHDSLNLISLKKTSINVDIEEINLIFEEIRLKLYYEYYKKSDNTDSRVTFVKHLNKVYLHNLCSPYASNDSIYNRILKLNFKVHLNYLFFKQIFSVTYWDTEFSEFNFYNTIIKMWDKNIANNIFPGYKSFNKLSFFNYFEFLITDSIKCLIEILNHTNTFGNSFMVNHSLIASYHRKLFEWSIYYKFYVKFGSTIDKLDTKAKTQRGRRELLEEEFCIIKKYIEKDIEFEEDTMGFTDTESIKNLTIEYDHFINQLSSYQKLGELKGNLFNDYDVKEKNQNVTQKLKELIELDNLSFVDPSYQLQEAIRNYHAAIETHTEGKAYRNLLSKMYLLNDDLNDRLYFFAIANERYKINNNIIKRNQRRLRSKFHYNSIFNHDKYMETIINI